MKAKLKLRSETLRRLSDAEAGRAAGGTLSPPLTPNTCIGCQVDTVTLVTCGHACVTQFTCHYCYIP